MSKWVRDVVCPDYWRNLHTGRLADERKMIAMGELNPQKTRKARSHQRKSRVTITLDITAEMIRKAFKLPAHASIDIHITRVDHAEVCAITEDQHLTATWEEIR